MAPLHLLLELKAKGDGPSRTAREMAADIGDATFSPNLSQHVPGVENVLADALSRRFDPEEQPWSLPRDFASAKEVSLPRRDETFQVTLKGPRSPLRT